MIRLKSAGGMILPDGLPGEFRITSFVRSVIPRSTCSAFSEKPVSSVSMNTGVPRAKTTISGKVTQ